MTRLERFMSHVEQRECWIWCGGTQSRGYGSATDGTGKSMLAHRASWELHRGAIPDGQTVDHLCHNKLCVNPEHLELVPLRVNCARGAGSSPLYCVNGHPLFGALGDWTRRADDGRRRCNLCARSRAAAQRAAARDPQPAHNRENHDG